ncbi:MAG: SDR family oxidoreductase [Aestuariibacter sp.]
MNQTINILVAGATGTNGRALLEQFVQNKVAVRAMVRDAEKAAHLANEYVQLVEADLAKPESLTAAFDGIEKAYIVTAISPETPEWFSNFYQAAKQANVKKLVKFSGLGADVNSPSEVIRQHGYSDQALIDSGLTYTILRPNSFHQNMFWQAEAIKGSKQFYLPLGEAKQSIVDVRDLAEVSFKILTEAGHDNKIYELTGPESLSFHEVAAQLSSVLNEQITYVPVPGQAALDAMLGQGMPQWSADVLVEIQELFATGKYAYVTDDLAKLLGREPTSFKQFAEDHSKLFK